MEIKLPDFIICKVCGRRLGVKAHLADLAPNTPEEQITRIVDRFSPPFTVQCACGHYIVSTPFEK